MVRRIKYLGTLAVLIFFIVVYIVSTHNSWFSIWKHAYSDLGMPNASYMRFYNYSIIFIIAPLMFLFSLYLIKISKNKTQTIGGAFILIASIFIALIGVYYKGTKPHDFVALWFFIQYFLGIFMYCFGDKKTRWLGIILFLLFWVGFLLPFPSVALAETYALILIAIFTTYVALTT